MYQDTKHLLDDFPGEFPDQSQDKDKSWVAVDVKVNDVQGQINQRSNPPSFGAPSCSAPSSAGSSLRLPATPRPGPSTPRPAPSTPTRTNPFTINSVSGNQMELDLAVGSPPLQDSQPPERLAAFASGDAILSNHSNDASCLNSPDQPSVNPSEATPVPGGHPGGHPPGHLTVPLYQGGFGRLRPGFATGRGDLMFSVTANYYGDTDPTHQSFTSPIVEPSKQSQLKQSKRMPFWMRYLIAQLVGVKTRKNEKPIIGTIFFTLTISLGLLYVCTHILFLSFNAKSKKTTLTTIEASLQVLNCFFGTSLGFYANRLAVKLFGNQRLLDSIRMHTKSVLKIRASIWALILILGFLAADFYDRYSEILVEPGVSPTSTSSPTPHQKGTDADYNTGYVTSCANLGLSPVVCQINVFGRLAFSAFAGLWNLLVLTVILSMCRTHTVGIRRFIKELEADGKVIENHYRSQVMDLNVNMFSVMINEEDENLEDSQESDDEFDFHHESVWANRLGQEEIRTQDSNIGIHSGEVPIIRREILNATSAAAASAASPTSSPTQARVQRATGLIGQTPCDKSAQSRDMPPQSRDMSAQSRDMSAQSRDMSGALHMTHSQTHDHGFRILSVNDILLRYWSINSRLSFTGLVIQRWVVCWIIFVMFWVAQLIVYWMKHDTEVEEVFLMAIPLILLPLLCSAVSEVNFEGDRLIRRLCPTSERLDLLLYITRNPLHLTIYGQAVRFGNMSNGLMGLATALFTGIAINQFMRSTH